MNLTHRIAIVGSREFQNWNMLREEVASHIKSPFDEIVSGGAAGADNMAQRFAKEFGHDIGIKYPKYQLYGKPATFIRNKVIAENSDLVLAFYRKDHFQEGGTANTAKWARQLGIELLEFEEE